jgi:hypothetical protein
MRTSFHHQSEAQPPNGPLTVATSPDTPSTTPATQSGLRCAACQLGLEGIVSKRLGSRYISGRSPVKMKNPACRSREAGGRGRLGPMIDDNGSRRSYRADRASAFTNNEDVP